MNKGVKLVFILVASLLSGFSVMAQSLQASVNKTHVAKNEVINLRVMADTEITSDAIDFSVLEEDFFLGQPRYGYSSNTINGQKFLRSEWSIPIAPMKEGIITIPSFSAGGMKTEPIQLQVTKDKVEPDLGDLFHFNMSVDNHTLYPKQSANLRMQLVIKADARRLENIRIAPPRIEGMKLEPVSQMEQRQRVISGLEVTVVEQSFRLTAEQSGTFTLFGPQLTGSYIYGSDVTGSTKIMPINTTVEQMPITVKPIPVEFNGNWLPASVLEITQSWQDDQGKSLSSHTVNTVSQGASITRTIHIKAKGTQAEYLPRITLDYPGSMRVYPEQPQFDTAKDGTVMMTVKQVLIPTEAGTFTLPGYTLNWWDIKNDEAKRANLSEWKLEVEQSDAGLITLPETTLPAPSVSNTNPAPENGANKLWQTLTVVFAGLWIITSAITFAIWKKRPVASKAPIPTSEKTLCVDALTRIITEGDEAKIERSVNEYLSIHRDRLNPEVIQAVKDELDAMNRARFSPNQLAWSHKALLEKVQKLAKVQLRKSGHQLEKL